MNIHQRIERFKRDELGRLLAQCTEEQIKVFKKLFIVDGSTEVVESDLISTIQVCERTITKNKRENDE